MVDARGPLGRDGAVKYNPALDGLRACAVVPVMLFHFSDERLCPGGYLGVDIFFVISGYLITTLLIADEERNQRIRYANFYARRALRLLPAIAAVLVFGAALAAIHRLPGNHSYGYSALVTVLLAQGVVLTMGGLGLGYIGHLWTLNAEIVFYLLWPQVLRAMRRFSTRQLGMALLTGVVFIAVVKSAVYPLIGGEPEFYLLPFRLDDFFVGALVAAVLRPLAGQLNEGLRLLLNASAWMAAIIITFLIVIPHTHARSEVVTDNGGGTATAMLVGVIIAATVCADRRSLARVLASKPLPALGLLSYGLYLYHQPINAFMGNRYPVGVRITVGLLVSVALAYLSRRLIEVPALVLRRSRVAS